MMYYVPATDYVCLFCTALNYLDGGQITSAEVPLLDTLSPGARYIVRAQTVRCRKCSQHSLRAGVFRARESPNPGVAVAGREGAFAYATQGGVRDEQLKPASSAKTYSEVPAAVLTDYVEAASIADRSPRSAAILARRTLESTLADALGIREGSLAKRLRDPRLASAIGANLAESLVGIKVLGNEAAHAGNDATGSVLEQSHHGGRRFTRAPRHRNSFRSTLRSEAPRRGGNCIDEKPGRSRIAVSVASNLCVGRYWLTGRLLPTE